MLLPFFRENEWEAEVLAVSPDDVSAPIDPWLAEDLPADVPVHRVAALALRWSRIPGLGGLGLRALGALKRAGDRLLSERRFDLVYFSTTVFEVHMLGPRWRRKFNVPFVIDYQDPWVNDYYRDHPAVTPPGGRLKFRIADAMHRWMEPRVLQKCAGLTAVSPAYPAQLRARYSFDLPPVLVQPFPGAKGDFERLRRDASAAGHDKIEWLYVGRGGADMATSLRALFIAIRDHAPLSLKKRLRLRFVGTSYAAAGKGVRTVVPIAEEVGLADLVEESPDRISYEQTLAMLVRADALIVPGSDDPSYTASKIYPYLLAGRPLLAVFHRESSVVDLMAKARGGVCVAFNPQDAVDAIAQQIADQWLSSDQFTRGVPLDSVAFEPYTDRGSAPVLCRFLERCLTN